MKRNSGFFFCSSSLQYGPRRSSISLEDPYSLWLWNLATQNDLLISRPQLVVSWLFVTRLDLEYPIYQLQYVPPDPRSLSTHDRVPFAGSRSEGHPLNIQMTLYSTYSLIHMNIPSSSFKLESVVGEGSYFLDSQWQSWKSHALYNYWFGNKLTQLRAIHGINSYKNVSLAHS